MAPRGSTFCARAISRSRRALSCVAESAGCARKSSPEGHKNAYYPRGSRSDTLPIPICAKKVTPTVAAESAHASRDVDADSRGEGRDGRRASRSTRGTPRASSARDGALVSVAVRMTALVMHEYPFAKKITTSSRRAASPAPRRRESRRAAAGVHTCAIDARVIRRSRRKVSLRARAGGPAFRARHLTNTAL